MNNVGISLILPVYNVEKYLGKCIDSILTQTFRNFEAIFVDDGSTDNSLSVLKQSQQRDSRIRIVMQENSGAGAARNRGLREATGKYVYFVDPDDFLDDTLLEKVYSTAECTNAEAVLFNAWRVVDDTGELVEWAYLNKDIVPKGRHVFSRKDCPDGIFQITTGAPWTKFYLRSFIEENGLQYQNLRHSNDSYFTYMAIALADRITYVDEKLYYYRACRKGSLQEGKENQPCCTIDAYMAIYAGLSARHIFYEVERSWAALMFDGIYFSLNTLHERQSHYAVLVRAKEPDVIATGLYDHPVSYYSNERVYNAVMGILNSHQFLKGNGQEATCLIRGCEVEVPLVSVIMPVYNVAPWLRAAADSILNQVLGNIELICVDDGSTDDSKSILLDIAKADKRVTVLHQENKGLSGARNSGIPYARGKYLYFMDSDDILASNCLEEMTAQAEVDSLDVICFAATTFFDSEKLQQQHGVYASSYQIKGDYSMVMTGPEALVKMTENGDYYSSACLKLYRREFYIESNLSFYDGILLEDNLFTLECFLSAKRIRCVKDVYFYRRVRENSIMTSKNTIAKLIGYYTCFTEAVHFAENLCMPYAVEETVSRLLRLWNWHVGEEYGALSANERKWAEIYFTPEQRYLFRAAGAGRQGKAKEHHADTDMLWTPYIQAINRHEEVVNRHEEVINRHNDSINHHWEIQKWHEERLCALEAAVNKRNIWRRIKSFLKRYLRGIFHSGEAEYEYN